MTSTKIGILLTNIGSPSHPTSKAVRHYLKKFLSDRRVVEIPRALWLPILYGIILPFRARSSAKLYQKIWTITGAPLVTHMQAIADKLTAQLQLPVVIGMHYGQPSIKTALENLRAQQIEKILILPLYPQYSATTTASTFDLVAATLRKWRNIPEIRMVHDYAIDQNYIDALCATIQKVPAHHLLFSFHGIPKRCIKLGDPYQQQCYATVQKITQKLQLEPNQWTLTFQSRLGRAEWLTPYTDKVLAELPKQGITNINVVCPGFAVDCLETLEEIALRGAEQFTHAGGKSFHYIPALNASTDSIHMLEKIIQKHIIRW